MILFKPSEDFVKALFAHHKITRNIKRENLSPELIASIQEKIGYTIRRALVEFAYMMLLQRLGEDRPDHIASIAMVIDIGGTRFHNDFNDILKNNLGIQGDNFGEDVELICKLKNEFQEWLIGLGGTLTAEQKNWPYLFVTILEQKGVSMNLNKKADLNLGN